MRGISTGQIVLLVVLGAILILTGVWAISVWSASSGVEMGTDGWIALGLALQLFFLRASESMGNHDSKIVDAGRVD